MILDLFRLDGKRALVTGAGRGLGRAMALGLAEAGADVALVARNAIELEETAGMIRSMGQKAAVYPFDMSASDKTPDLAEEVNSTFGHITILVNNAGTTTRHPAAEYPLDEWENVISVNLTSAFALAREFGARMLDRGYGKIINTGSIGSTLGIPFCPAYVASKGGIWMLTRALAVEWASKGINVNAIGPGYFETSLTEPLRHDDNRAPKILSKIPMGRWGNPDELKGAVVYLASPASDYVTGQILYVDGGWTAE